MVCRWQGDLSRARDLIGKLMQRTPDYPLGLFTQGEIFLASDGCPRRSNAWNAPPDWIPLLGTRFCSFWPWRII
ncbi:hypothetical protein ACFMPD_00650 [Sedimentitalea sp. HM32M-2]|uniref:hypothetical protein n=1 Tax=Sedimentitalea sp. HM32M-2 TaxID=3351566 RepID=UPI00362FAC5E